MPGIFLVGLPAIGVPFIQEDIDDVVAPATPVDTGYLQSQWTITEGGFVIQNDTDYASYVEYGTRNQEPQHYLASTLEQLFFRMYEREPELLDDYEPGPGEFEIFVGF